MGSVSTSYRTTNRILLALLAGSLVVPALLPFLAGSAPWALPRCYLKELLGIPCPLCGMTRGIAALLRGDVRGACAFNVLALPGFLLLLAELPYRAWTSLARFAEERARRMAAWDARIHLWLAALYLLYALCFLARQFAGRIPTGYTG